MSTPLMADLRRFDTPVVPLLVTLPCSIGFVVWRWFDAAHQRLSAFVLAGSTYVSRSRLPRGFPIRTGGGYDGEFYYRLALDPFDLRRTAFGIQFDTMSRVERMGYPFLAWLASAGDHARVPLTLVVVNVVAAALLAYFGALFARRAGRHALWGLVFPLYWGYLWTLGRDLTELTTAACVVAALAALRSDKATWAGLALLGAVLSKETSVLLVLTLAGVALWTRVRTHVPVAALAHHPQRRSERALASSLQPSDVAWILPLFGFALWQVVLTIGTGTLPIFRSGGDNLGFPFDGMLRGLSQYILSFPSSASGFWLVELALLCVLIGVTWQAVRRGDSPVELRALWVASVILGICAAPGIWKGDVGFRSLDDIYLTSWAVLLTSRLSLRPWVLACTATWIVVAVELIRYI